MAEQSAADAIRAQQSSVSRAVIAGVVGGANQEFNDSFKQHKSSIDAAAGNAFEALNVSQFEDVQAIESLCMNCHQQGLTRLLITRIPYFRDIIIMAFECPHCSHRTNDVQSANEIAVDGLRLTLTVTNAKALNRQVIKEQPASILLPELEFEIPPRNARGAEINTIEGFLANSADNLQLGQPDRYVDSPDVARRVQEVIDELRALANGERFPFTFVIDDPSGNSMIQNIFAPAKDPFVKVLNYTRSPAQNRAIGIAADLSDEELAAEEAAAAALPAISEADESGEAASAAASSSSASSSSSSSAPVSSTAAHANRITLDPRAQASIMKTYFDVNSQAVQFASVCNQCGRGGETRMCIMDIPFFKEIVLMVQDCTHCGFKDTEVKPGGAVSAKGKRVSLQVRGAADLRRDLLKSDTAGVSIPEIELELEAGTLGGKYTTVEGLLVNIREKLLDSNMFSYGDSSVASEKSAFTEFLRKLDEVVNVAVPFTLILDDPMGNAFIHNPNYPDTDPQLSTEEYERTAEQDDELGLTHMKVENYD